MGTAFRYGLITIALLILLPTAAVFGKHFGTKVKGGLLLGAILLGFGAVVDPPQKHAIEAAEPRKETPENDEPPLD